MTDWILVCWNPKCPDNGVELEPVETVDDLWTCPGCGNFVRFLRGSAPVPPEPLPVETEGESWGKQLERKNDYLEKKYGGP